MTNHRYILIHFSIPTFEDNKAIINSKTYGFFNNLIECTNLLFSLSKLKLYYPTSSTSSFDKLNSLSFSVFIITPILLGLKLVSIIFYFYTKQQPFKNYKKCFLFHLKSSFHSWDIYSSFCNFFASFPHFPDSKGQMKVEYLCQELGYMK